MDMGMGVHMTDRSHLLLAPHHHPNRHGPTELAFTPIVARCAIPSGVVALPHREKFDLVRAHDAQRRPVLVAFIAACPSGTTAATRTPRPLAGVPVPIFIVSPSPDPTPSPAPPAAAAPSAPSAFNPL